MSVSEKLQRGNLMLPVCPSREVLRHITSRWGILVLIALEGGAIAHGHPLGMSGARIAGTAALELAERGGKIGLATMCIGVGQGIAVAFERA